MTIRDIISILPAIFLIFALQAGCAGDTDKEMSRKETRGNNRVHPVRTLVIATEKLNRHCPEMIDPETRLDSVALTGERHLAFYYTMIGRDRGTFNEDAFEGYIFPRILDNVHFNPDLKMHRDSSIIMEFYYRDRNGAEVLEITLSPDMYQ